MWTKAASDMPWGTNASVAGELVYAIGDVHGRYDLMTRLLARIADDVKTRGNGRRPIVVFCGDYVDRGPESAKILSALVWMRTHAEFDPYFLKGNHEEMMLAYIDDPIGAQGWLNVGGAQTLQSYGVTLPDPAVSADYYRARDELMERMPASHLRLLQTLSLSHRIGDYAFVHAGVRPGVPLHRQVAADLLWIRDDFLDHKRRFEKIIVHGHSWDSDQPVIREQRIGIDTGAYKTGVLTAVRLEDGRVECLQARIDQSDDPIVSVPATL